MNTHNYITKACIFLIAVIGFMVMLKFAILDKITPENVESPHPNPIQTQSMRSLAENASSIATLSEDVIQTKDIPWLESVQAGLVVSQDFDSIDNEPRGTVMLGSLTIDLGETPPFYRHQIQTATCPIMLGEKHERQFYHINVLSLLIGKDGMSKEHPLSVSYPRWPSPNAGLATTGGFVFIRDEQPVRSIGVIVPKVIPAEGDTLDMLDWQIQIRVNDKMSDVDINSLAKPHLLDSGTIVLMATNPHNIPTNSNVVWFKLEGDGTVSLKEN